MSKRKLTWRKLLSDPPSEWKRLPLLTRGVGDEILRAVDSDGEIYCGTEQPAAVVCRLTAAHPRERRRVAKAVEELIAAGFVRISMRDGSTILSVQLPDLCLAAEDQNRTRTEPGASPNLTRSEPEHDAERARTVPEVEPNSAESFGPGSGEEKREEERREEKRREEINSPTRRRGGLSRPCSRARAREGDHDDGWGDEPGVGVGCPAPAAEEGRSRPQDAPQSAPSSLRYLHTCPPAGAPLTASSAHGGGLGAEVGGTVPGEATGTRVPVDAEEERPPAAEEARSRPQDVPRTPVPPTQVPQHPREDSRLSEPLRPVTPLAVVHAAEEAAESARIAHEDRLVHAASGAYARALHAAGGVYDLSPRWRDALRSVGRLAEQVAQRDGRELESVLREWAERYVREREMRRPDWWLERVTAWTSGVTTAGPSRRNGRLPPGTGAGFETGDIPQIPAPKRVYRYG